MTRQCSIAHRLRSHWELEGVPLNPGVGEHDILAYEKRFGIILPPDVRQFFLLMNGTAAMDHENRQFFSLPTNETSETEFKNGFQYLKPYSIYWKETDWNYPITPEDRFNFVLVDVLIMSTWYGIRLSSDASAPTPVNLDGEDLFPSFADFAEAYLAGTLPM